MSQASSTSNTPENLEAIIEAGTFQDILDVLTSVDEECVLQLSRDGLSARLIDGGNAYMVDLDAGTDAFASTCAGLYAIGADLERLGDIVGKADDGDLVSFTLNTKTRKLNIRFGDAVDYDMAGIDPDSIRNSPDEPDLDHTNQFSAPAHILDNAVDIATLAGDAVEIEADPDDRCVRFMSQGDIDHATVELDDELTTADVQEKASSKMSAGSTTGNKDTPGYLTMALGVIPSDAEVTVNLGDSMPITMDWTFPDADVEVQQLIAPRVDTST